MIKKSMYCEEFFKRSCNQVLVHVSDNDNMVTGVLLQQLIEVSLQERNELTTLPLWAVTHTQQDGLMLSPYLEEHLQMSRKSDLEWLDRQAFVERDSDTTKGPACPVASMPPRVSSQVPKVVRD
ncbi:hypothetical protein Pcinc_021438 [Petrolisthes cinctipes]|uniref:Uncharacterized protein n=1 Tax=Petrolisthes cinctipes TaxID=88211 RepID=A0AAE1KID4_PETCI|nr:hypothetical protein Pcinc_021438 [Petrolisthes cinctipes]